MNWKVKGFAYQRFFLSNIIKSVFNWNHAKGFAREPGRRGDEEMGVFQYCLVILLGISYVVSSFRFQVTFL